MRKSALLLVSRALALVLVSGVALAATFREPTATTTDAEPKSLTRSSAGAVTMATLGLAKT
jgi:hypothetical protein